MSRKLTYLATTALLLTVALTGCQREPLPDAAIRFSVSPVGLEASSTKAITDNDKPTTETSLVFDNSSVKLYGHLTPSGKTDKTAVFTDQDLICKESSGAFSWGYTPLMYWVRNAAYDFRAIFPPSASIHGNSIDGLAVDYKMQKDVSGDKQRSDYDLMTASASVTSAPPTGNSVTLTFNHVCAAVRFVFKDAGTTVSNYQIKSFELQGLYAENTYDVSAGAWKDWTTSSSRVSPVWGWTTDCSPLTSDYDYLKKKDTGETVSGWFFAVPQELNADSKISFTYTVGTSTQELPITLSLVTSNISKWEIGKVYTYKIQILANAIGFTVEWTDWADQGENIFDPIWVSE